MKTFKYTIEVDLEELPQDERDYNEHLIGDEDDELPTMEDISPSEFADAIEGAVMNYEEIFSGTGMYAKVAAVRVIEQN